MIMEVFSDGIKKEIGDDKLEFFFEGALAKTYRLEGNTGKIRFLKVQNAKSYESLRIQMEKLKWLEDKLPVPRVVFYQLTAEREYLITEEIQGIDGTKSFPQEKLSEIVATIARGLSDIHRIDITSCPFDNTLARYLRIAIENYRAGKVDSEELKTKFGNGNVDEVYERLMELSKGVEEDLVFTHGDYSMPNVVLKDSKINGFLDLGSCGVADRYADLAIAEKSVIRNYGKEYVETFYKAYGVDCIDRHKVEFYQLLECFVYA